MDTFERVKGILCEQLDLEDNQVTKDAEIIDDLGADSLDIVDLVMTLEEEFDTEIPDEEIESLKTVNDIVKYIDENAG
ncbi:MAG: acyl carrier protein [Oscillospiraceae bacterium]